MVKKFTIPFASQGDANDIPDALQADGKVSFTQGFGYDYERPYDDPQAKDIAREDMNGLFKAITSAVGELQALGASEWSSAIAYPKGAIVYYEKDLYISQVDDNQNEPPQSWVSITSIANDSLKKAANLSDLTDKTTARNNLGLGSSATLNKTDVLGASTSLVATQKLVNDTKINLESSKQDKLTFTGTGNVARMSEVDKKITGGSVVQEAGSSTTDVMSQKAVTDQLNAIKSGHGLGYGQSWVDVTGSRSGEAVFTNTTGRTIQIFVAVQDGGSPDGVDYSVGALTFKRANMAAGSDTDMFQIVVPDGVTYRVSYGSNTLKAWWELR